MDILAAYKVGITVLIPVFSAITCLALVALSLRDCLSEEERRLKKILLVYLSLSALGWYMTFCYEFHPVLFTWLNVLCLLSFVLPSIFFYRIVRYLTRLGEAERFSPLHYLLPGVLAGVLFVWSLLVPREVQIEIVEGKALVFPAGYEAFTRFFTLKPLLRVIFGMAYYVLTIAVLVRFYRRTNGKPAPVRQTAGWVVFLVGISIASLLSSLLPTFMPRATILHSLWTLLAALLGGKLFGLVGSRTTSSAASTGFTPPPIIPPGKTRLHQGRLHRKRSRKRPTTRNPPSSRTPNLRAGITAASSPASVWRLISAMKSRGSIRRAKSPTWWRCST